MTMFSSIRKRLLFGVGLAVLCAGSTAANASALTLGAVAPPNLGGCGSCDAFQLTVGAGAPRYRVPAGPTGLWTITSWSSQGGGIADGKARLRVYRRTQTAGQFELIKQSHLGLVPAAGSPDFATDIKVKKGDLLGIGTQDNVPSGYSTGVTGGNVKAVGCDPTGPGQLVGNGTSCPLSDFPGEQINVSATLTPR
jgi:hypothetical protein